MSVDSKIVRIVAEALCPGDLGPCDDCVRKAQQIVEALTSAGWVDLAAVPAIATPREMDALRSMERAVERAERAEAAIARVEALCDEYAPLPGRHGMVPGSTLRAALRGDQP